MKVLVFSDSHGRVQPMIDLVDLYKPQAIFHLGDVVRDAEALHQVYPDIPLYSATGNCDWDQTDPVPEKKVKLAGKTILYMHGHTCHVKQGVEMAVHRAREEKADLLLFGHTHIPFHRDYGGLKAVNPGAAGSGVAAFLLWEDGSETVYFPVDTKTKKF